MCWSTAYAPAALADGSYSVTVTQTEPDGARNAAMDFTLDRTPPAVATALIHETGFSLSDSIIQKAALAQSDDPNVAVFASINQTAASQIATADTLGTWHYISICDGAGWHQAGGAPVVPDNIALLHRPPSALN